MNVLNRVRASTSLIIWFAGVFSLCSQSNLAAYDGPFPLIFDAGVGPFFSVTEPFVDDDGWHYEGQGTERMRSNVTPTPRVGTDESVLDPIVEQLYLDMTMDDRPVNFYLWHPFAFPISGDCKNDTRCNSNALNEAYSMLTDLGLSRLDYVFTDFETEPKSSPFGEIPRGTVDNNIMAVVAMVHSQASFGKTRVGTYAYYPVESVDWHYQASDPGIPTAGQLTDRYDRVSLDVAMPNLYPYEFYVNHTSEIKFPGNASPNERAALFWAPLEKFQATARKLREPAYEGHEVIPWITDFVPVENFEAAKPPREDNKALVKHLRLRGADGLMLWRPAKGERLNEDNVADGAIRPDEETYGPEATNLNNEAYRTDMLAAWSSLDSLFDMDGELVFLNDQTSKTSGIEWSGVQVGNEIHGLISNLSDEPKTVDFPSHPGLPDFSFEVPAGEHREFHYTVPEPSQMSLLLVACVLFSSQRKLVNRPFRLAKNV